MRKNFKTLVKTIIDIKTFYSGEKQVPEKLKSLKSRVSDLFNIIYGYLHNLKHKF